MRDLTVLIPTWNDAEALSVTLTAFASLPTELKDRLDVVVSDGASSDHTWTSCRRTSTWCAMCLPGLTAGCTTR